MIALEKIERDRKADLGMMGMTGGLESLDEDSMNQTMNSIRQAEMALLN